MEINDIQQKIVSEIHKLHGRKNFVGENIMVCCPFHNDSNPSAGVFVGVGMDVPLGFFSCMGCGAKGHWNTWAPKAGLEPVPEWQLRAATELSIGGVSKIVDDVGRTKRFKRVRDLMAAVARKAYIEWPEQTDWRGYNGKLLHDFGALLNMPAGADLPVCFLPCNVRGNYVGGVAGYFVWQSLSAPAVTNTVEEQPGGDLPSNPDQDLETTPTAESVESEASTIESDLNSVDTSELNDATLNDASLLQN